LLDKVIAVLPSLTAKLKRRLERRYAEVVPRHVRELAEASGFPTPNRYIPAAEAEPIVYPEDAAAYEDVGPFYAGGNGAAEAAQSERTPESVDS
jgi:hypothetical protein